MAMDGEGRLWLLFEGRGLGCLHPDGTFEFFEAPADVPLPLSFPHMVIGDDGRIWIGGMGGLVLRETKKIDQHRDDDDAAAYPDKPAERPGDEAEEDVKKGVRHCSLRIG